MSVTSQQMGAQRFQHTVKIPFVLEQTKLLAELRPAASSWVKIENNVETKSR